MIKVSVDFKALSRFLTDLSDKQVPFAASRALNDVALGLQEAQRGEIQRRFTLRRPEWVLQGVKIPRFSNKNDSPLSVTVMMDEGAGRGNIMSKFEAGGTKKPRAGTNIAIPIMARPARGQIVPKDLRPRALNLQAVGRSIRGDRRTFMLPTRGGRMGIFQRTDKGTIRLLYLLKPTTPLPPMLRFYGTVTPLIDELWELNFSERFAEALRTAR